MDAQRLRRGELIAGGSAVLLFIVMFLNWFGISEEDSADISADDAEHLVQYIDIGDTRLDLNAWQAFSFIDIILLVAIVVAVGTAVMTAASRSPNLPVAASAITAGLGILATVLILFRIIVTPYDLGRDFWVFIGLLLAAGIAYGGWELMREEGTSFAGEAERVQHRPPADGGGTPPPPPPPPAGGNPPAGGGTGV